MIMEQYIAEIKYALKLSYTGYIILMVISYLSGVN